MEVIFKIAKYQKNNDGFDKIGYDEYTLTYLKGRKVHQVRIVINGYLTKEVINLISFNEGYKSKILRGIREYLDNHKTEKNKVSKKITLDYIKTFYSKLIVRNIQSKLLIVNRENSRDKLTKYGLIDIDNN